MNRRRKRTIAIAATAALAALGGGVAYAATSANDPRDELLSDAAQRLDVSPEELRSALEGAFGDQLDDAVRAGRLTQQQADRMKQAIRQHGLPLGGPGGPGFGPPDVMFHGPIGPGLDAAADYLGLTRAELGRRLMNGRSLAQIARAEGKSVDGLEQAIVDAAEADLDRAVADGDLSDAQRDELLRRLREHVDELVAGKGHRPGGPRFHHRFEGPGGGPGFELRGGPGGPPPPPWHD
ncbi:MAG TPA: hypothetical protein VK506_11290 [Conexibacter sp.]|nr:hypothetical protein [Conexibacter sp.]